MKKEIKSTVRFIPDEYGITHVISDWAQKRARPSPPLTNVPYYTVPTWPAAVERAKAEKEAKEAAESDEQPQD